MNTNTIKGVIKLINEVKVISDKFSVLEFVISVPDGKYIQDIILSLVNDKIDIIKPYVVGQEVEVSYNLRGREYNGRYYNTLDACKIQSTGSVMPQTEDDGLPW